MKIDEIKLKIQAIRDKKKAQIEILDRELQAAEQELIDSLGIQEGDIVKIKETAGSGNMGFHPYGEERGKPLLGRTTVVDSIRVDHEAEVTYTTDIRDSLGLRWCWERHELELVSHVTAHDRDCAGDRF